MYTTDTVLPITDERSADWFAATAEGRFLLQRCGVCDHVQFYPRRLCVRCGSFDVVWSEAAGTGRLHTFSVIHRTPNPEFAPEVPYVFAIVELDEGPRVTTRIVDVSFDELHCEMPVEVVFPSGGDGEPVLPVFTRKADA